MLTAKMSMAMRLAPSMGSRTSVMPFKCAHWPCRVSARSMKAAAAQQSPPNGNTQVPVERQQAAQHQQNVARNAPPPPQQQQPQQPPVGRRLQRQPLTATLLPLADFGSVAPGFGRVGGFLRSIEDEMDSMMRALENGDNMTSTGSTLASPSATQEQALAVPLQVDIHDLEKEIVIEADTPGMTGDNVKVTYEPETRTLAISGERSSGRSEKDAGGRFSRYERRFGAFQRRFQLPRHVNTAAISAKLTNGELEVWVPKTEESVTRQEIKVQ